MTWVLLCYHGKSFDVSFLCRNFAKKMLKILILLMNIRFLNKIFSGSTWIWNWWSPRWHQSNRERQRAAFGSVTACWWIWLWIYIVSRTVFWHAPSACDINRVVEARSSSRDWRITEGELITYSCLYCYCSLLLFIDIVMVILVLYLSLPLFLNG